MKYLIPIFLLALLTACANPESLIQKDEGTWKLLNEIEELAFDEGLVYSKDTAQSASLVFDENMVSRVDSNGTLQYRWFYDKKEETLTLLDQDLVIWVSGTAVQRSSYVFKVLESKRNEQLWRYEETFRTFSPFTSDTATATLTIHWRLGR
jgi:hypothetical protein